MKLKDTLNLGKTEFPMRAGLPTIKTQFGKEWEDLQNYYNVQELNLKENLISPCMGLPYANGNIHVGHAMNKISKDIIVRSKSMSGFFTHFIFLGGILMVCQSSKYCQNKVSNVKKWTWEYLKLCREYALSQVDKQREDFKRLGVSGDWENPYVTLTPDYLKQLKFVYFEMANIRVISTVVPSQFTGHGHLSQLAEEQRENNETWFQLPYYMPTR